MTGLHHNFGYQSKRMEEGGLDNRFNPNGPVAVTEARRIGWVPPRAPDANLDGLALRRTYPYASNYGSLLLPGPAPAGRPSRDAAGKVGCRETQFKHQLILNGTTKDQAWFRTKPKSEFSSAYLKR